MKTSVNTRPKLAAAKVRGRVTWKGGIFAQRRGRSPEYTLALRQSRARKHGQGQLHRISPPTLVFFRNDVFHIFQNKVVKVGVINLVRSSWAISC